MVKSDGDLSRIRNVVESFLASTNKPVLLEEGDDPIALDKDNYSIECRSGRLTLAAWDSAHNITRRVVAVEKNLPGRLQLRILKLGGKSGRMMLYDQDGPRNSGAARRGSRLVAREWFRRFLRRQFPGWRITSLSGDAHLEQSLSPAYPRALVTMGTRGWAAMAAPEATHADGLLTFGLIWLDYLRRKQLRTSVTGLILLLPEGHHRTTCLRLRHLKSDAARFQVFVHGADGWEDQLDLKDYGNLDTHLETFRDPAMQNPAEHPVLSDTLALPGVEAVGLTDGALSLRIRGLEFARFQDGSLLFGIREKRVAGEHDLKKIRHMVAELNRLRSADNADRTHSLRIGMPESWIESQVRANLETLAADLLPAPVYGQVLAFAGGSRGIIDLLGAERSGRLAVLELKATADLHLPLQALDYWMRVRWHLERGEFTERGYFPGRTLTTAPPRLLLVAPALEFHSTTETILQFFADEIPVERVGLCTDWRRRLGVAFRCYGSQAPGMT